MEENVKQETINNQKKMIKWVQKQPKNKFPDLFKMLKKINIHWGW